MDASQLMKFKNILKNPIIPGSPFDNNFDKNIFKFPNHNLSTYFPITKFVRCPICLGQVIAGKSPNNCFHIYCSLCISKWGQYYRICPTCRRKYQNLLTVNLTEVWIRDQLEDFATYMD